MIQAVSKQVTTGATIEVDITPGQAYLIRDMQVQQVTIAPGAQGGPGSSTTSALTMQYYNWLEPSFRIYAPYHVVVLKNGVQIGSADLGGQLNKDGSPVSPQQTIQTSDGTIIIQNLGGLQGTYTNPAMPNPIAILQGQPYIYDWSSIQSMVNGASAGSVAGAQATKYSDYWFGISRTSGNLAYNPTITISGQITNVYTPSSYGGWEGANSGGNIQGVKPVLYSADKSSLPSDKRSFMCLTEWLQNKGVANLAAGGSSVLSKYSSYAMVTDNGGAALKINIPWNAYLTPLVTMRVPSEMADTWVERPQVSDVSVSARWQANNQKSIDITDQAVLAVTLTQQSSVTSSARIAVYSSNPRISVYPIQTTETMASGATKVVLFTVSQTGGTTTDSNVQLTINSYETYTGSLKHSDTVTCNLLPTVGVESTTLNLLVQDDSKAHTPIEGLQLVVQYPPSTGQIKTAFTDSNGAVTLNIDTSAGGGYTGQLTVTTEDTLKYEAAYVTSTVHNGQNNVIVTVHVKGTDYPFDWMTVALIAGILIVVAVVGGFGYRVVKRGRRRR